MVTVIPRSAWGARYPNGATGKNGQPIIAPLPAREVWLHHSVAGAPDLVPPFTDDDAAVRTLETIGQQRFGQGISYTWPITPTGRVYEGHSVNRQGAHTGGRNSIARAICFVGDYDVDEPTPQMIEAAAQLLVQEFRAGRIVAARLNGGHRNAPGASTACPGRYGMEAIPVINSRAAAILGGQAPTPIEEDDDMPTVADIWMSETVSPLTGNMVHAIELLKAAVVHSYAGRIAAEQAKALAEAHAQSDGPLSAEDVQRIAERTAAEVAEDLSEGYDLTATPKSDA